MMTRTGTDPPTTVAGGRRSRQPGRWRFVALVGALTVLTVLCAGVGLGQLSGLNGVSGLLGADREGHSRGVLGRSAPATISIPALGVRARVVQVGQAADGSIATPADDPAGTAGWYGSGPSPGEPGTAVIVGHVDTADRPAVFQKLADLSRGRLIEVRREDRRVATFTVASVERFPKTAFPVGQVFTATDRPRLVLVTCGGRWVGGDVGYTDNVIAFADLT